MDKALTDVQMTVYVDKSGRLASMDAVTFVNTESFAGDEGVKQVKIDFHAEVKAALTDCKFCDYHRPYCKMRTM